MVNLDLSSTPEQGAASPASRHKARHFALQAIYQWQMTEQNAGDIEQQFLEDQPVRGADLGYLHALLTGVADHCLQLDAAFAPYLSRPLNDLDLVDKAILRLATFELVYCPEVPFKVVINEAILLAKSFASADSHKFVNGVLDKVQRQLAADSNHYGAERV